MTPEEAIKQLEFDRDMILFDPTTGEEITPEILKALNKDNFLTYVANGVAIEALKEIQQYRKIGTVEEIKKAKACIKLLRRIKTLEGIMVECLEYERIGTVEECREATEKQKPKTCEFYGDEEDGKLLCPNCGEDLWDLKECGFDNCPYCGQAVTL